MGWAERKTPMSMTHTHTVWKVRSLALLDMASGGGEVGVLVGLEREEANRGVDGRQAGHVAAGHSVTVERGEGMGCVLGVVGVLCRPRGLWSSTSRVCARARR